jgi:serine/threonine protein kinase
MANREAFIDFVHGLLNINPLERWSPQQARTHPFITQQKYTGPFQPQMNLKTSSRSPAPGVQQQQQAEALSKQRAQAQQQQQAQQAASAAYAAGMHNMSPGYPSSSAAHVRKCLHTHASGRPTSISVESTFSVWTTSSHDPATTSGRCLDATISSTANSASTAEPVCTSDHTRRSATRQHNGQ